MFTLNNQILWFSRWLYILNFHIFYMNHLIKTIGFVIFLYNFGFITKIILFINLFLINSFIFIYLFFENPYFNKSIEHGVKRQLIQKSLVTYQGSTYFLLSIVKIQMEWAKRSKNILIKSMSMNIKPDF